jgi:hypothetical protein
MALDYRLRQLYSKLVDEWIDDPSKIDHAVLSDINDYVIANKTNINKKKTLSLQTKRLISYSPAKLLSYDDKDIEFPEDV